METLFFDLMETSAVLQYPLQLYSLTSWDRAADFANRPGFAKLNALGFRSGKAF